MQFVEFLEAFSRVADVFSGGRNGKDEVSDLSITIFAINIRDFP